MRKLHLLFALFFCIIFYSQNQNTSFHDTQGNIEVSGSGQLQYTLPIALPPGIKSVAPQINLLYSSGSGNGIAGYGWNLSGLTAITRMGKTIEKDGEVGGIQLDYSDYYSFNGQRLLLKSGEYGKDGAEYVTEKFSNVKIKSIGSLSGVSWKGPAYWEVTFEDGSQAWYGGTGLQDLRGQTSMDYNIVKWKDRNGNTIEYQYTINPTLLNGVPNGEVVKIKKILWGGNETLGKSHYNEILFSYRERNVKEVSYHLGKHYYQDSILEHVTVKTKGKQFKKYVFSHVKKGDTEYEFLDKITEYNSDDVAANPVVFEYGNTGHGHWVHSPHASNQGNSLQGDFDGDGKMDMIKYLDAHENCLEYEEVEDEDGIYYPHCVRSETKPAGLYLFRSTLDSQPVEKVYLQGFDLGKWYFEQASTALTLKTSSGFLSSGQGFVVYKKIPISPTPNSNNPRYSDEVVKMNIELHYYSVGENSVTKEYVHTIPHTVYDNSQGSTSPYIPGTQMMNWGYIRTLFSGVRAMDIDADGISELVAEIRNEYFEFISDGNDVGGVNAGYQVWKQTYDNKEVSNDLAQTDRPSDTGLSIGIGGGSYTPQCTYIYNYLVIDHQGNISLINPLPTPLESRKSIFSNDNKHGDFNGNGKPDFISARNNIPWLIEFDKNIQNGNIELKSTPFFSDENNSNIEGLLYSAKTGDFNGDGKTDLLLPLGVDNADWFVYTSTGSYFIKQRLPAFSVYKPLMNGYHKGGRYYRYDRHYLVQDMNGDGKSDFLEIGVHTRKNRKDSNSFSEFLVVYHENIGFGNHISFREKNIDGHYEQTVRMPFAPFSYDSYPFVYRDHGGDTYHLKLAPSSNRIYIHTNSLSPIFPVIGDMYINYSNHQLLLFSPRTLLKYSSNTLSRISQITKIHQGGLTTEVEYRPLSNADSTFYNPEKREQYPYVEIKNASQSYAVSKLKQHTDHGIRQQDFRYRGLTAHLHGKGMLGFRKTARTSWYTDNTKNTIIWSGVETDPLQEGVPVKEWSIKSVDEAFPSDLTFNNNQLLSLKITEYRKDILASGIQAIVPVKTQIKDFQKAITTISTIEYDEYYLPTKTTVNTNNGFAIKTTEIDYYPPNLSGIGSDYNIGRPRSKTELIRAYGDSKGAKEDYEYENHQLKAKTSYNQDNTGWIKDTYTYDGFGNILQTTKSNSVDNQTITERVEYDADGRFVIKKIDNFGLETQIYYNDWGQVLRQTDPFGVETTTAYDAWGKVLNIQSSLGGRTEYVYEKRDGHLTRVVERRADGGETITVKNKVGNVLWVSEKSLESVMHSNTFFKYDELGREIKRSRPILYPEFTFWIDIVPLPYQWNTTEYDDFSRPIKATAYTGKILETQYDGLVNTITETNAHGRFKKQTMDALGNIVSSEDLGGVIHFKYNALGQNIEAKYGNNTVTTKYDHWGRKVEFNDPSNGIYRYEYNGFGALTKTISPKGYKTYTLNNKGQLISQNEVSNDGHSTQKDIQFEYNTKGQLTKKQGTSNGESYQTIYTYDSYGRSTSVVETHHGKTFTHDNIDYDHLSRVASYRKSIQSGSQTTAIEVQNIYGTNGILQEIKDKNTGQTLWELHQIDAEGKVLSATLGRANITNIYSPQGFITNMNHSFGSTTFAQVSYEFDAIKNELKSRVTGGDFNILETFEYDHQNRLINWTDPVTGHFAQNAKRNVYDSQGRITYNDDFGEVKFANPQSIYRPSGATLNAQGEQNLANNFVQHIHYNENNDPIFIDGLNADVRFEYGLNNMRQVMVYGGNSPFQTDLDFAKEQYNPFIPIGYGLKFMKYYSEDGSFEIIRDNNTQQEKHIIYIGGSPYESEIVYLKNFNETAGSYKFLHKDYLGSILAISDEAGNKVEQRHYDAWGNLTHLQIGNGSIQIGRLQPTAYGLLLDRGYTSHEHLFEVGLIHMNGRLYDPLLRRFLNADEHIQDPYNTQNYNKYGYVYNNPLMYNDPSGEIFFFAALAVALKSTFWAGVVAGAIGGAIIGGSLYIGQAFFTGNFSLEGFAKAFFGGALTGAISGALGQVFSAGTFWGSVGNGALAGAGAGGMNALINGQNFLEGLVKGAVIGGVIGGIDYTLNFYSKGGGKQAGADFWSGKAKLDLSEGYGAHGVDQKVLNSEIEAKYVGNYRGVNVYESSIGFGEGSNSGGLTLPPNKIVVGKGAYALRNIQGRHGTYDLFTHEFGHILQAKKIGEMAFYHVIAPNSVYSASVNTYMGHQQFWTETWANQLSYNYFTNRKLPFNVSINIAKPLSQKYISILKAYLSAKNLKIPKSWNTIP